MDCSKVQDRLAGYLQDDLRLTERLIVDVHIAYCAACRAELEEVRAVLAACRRVLRHPSPRHRYAELRARLAYADRAAAPPLRERLHPRRLSKGAAIAAAFLIMAGASTPLFIPRSWMQPIGHTEDPAHSEDISIVVIRASDSTGWDATDDLWGHAPFMRGLAGFESLDGGEPMGPVEAAARSVFAVDN
jgi:anti-sigma factor ChrR (cupin superfamily)